MGHKDTTKIENGKLKIENYSTFLNLTKLPHLSGNRKDTQGQKGQKGN